MMVTRLGVLKSTENRTGIICIIRNTEADSLQLLEHDLNLQNCFAYKNCNSVFLNHVTKSGNITTNMPNLDA
jgi:hypothetical protein